MIQLICKFGMKRKVAHFHPKGNEFKRAIKFMLDHECVK